MGAAINLCRPVSQSGRQAVAAAIRERETFHLHEWEAVMRTDPPPGHLHTVVRSPLSLTTACTSFPPSTLSRLEGQHYLALLLSTNFKGTLGLSLTQTTLFPLYYPALQYSSQISWPRAVPTSPTKVKTSLSLNLSQCPTFSHSIPYSSRPPSLLVTPQEGGTS